MKWQFAEQCADQRTGYFINIFVFWFAMICNKINTRIQIHHRHRPTDGASQTHNASTLIHATWRRHFLRLPFRVVLTQTFREHFLRTVSKSAITPLLYDGLVKRKKGNRKGNGVDSHAHLQIKKEKKKLNAKHIKQCSWSANAEIINQTRRSNRKLLYQGTHNVFSIFTAFYATNMIALLFVE